LDQITEVMDNISFSDDADGGFLDRDHHAGVAIFFHSLDVLGKRGCRGRALDLLSHKILDQYFVHEGSLARCLDHFSRIQVCESAI
jgi:hypothetical protein